MQNPAVSQSNNLGPRQQLAARLKACSPNEVAALLAATDASLAFEALAELNPSFTQDRNCTGRNWPAINWRGSTP